MNASTQRSEKSPPIWGCRTVKDLNYHWVSASAPLITPTPRPPINFLIFIGYKFRDNGYVNEINKY